MLEDVHKDTMGAQCSRWCESAGAVAEERMVELSERRGSFTTVERDETRGCCLPAAWFGGAAKCNRREV